MPITADERALAERDLAIWKQHFVELVAENRHLSIDAVNNLADGSSLPGTLALQAGLIDALGDQNTALTWFAQKLGLEEVVVGCE